MQQSLPTVIVRWRVQLAICWKTRVSTGTRSYVRRECLPEGKIRSMTSDNPRGADNQQERSGFEQWIVGFVDGEGCFAISIVRNDVCRLGWQVQHEFSVTQGAPSVSALRLLEEYFGVGRLIPNRRSDNHHTPLWRFSVKRRSQLVNVIVPFFEEHPLRTAKRADFEKFCAVLQLMQDGQHLNMRGLERIAALTEQMNRKQRSRFLESSEAIRQPARSDTELKIWS